jgi:hypothetical protein
MNESTQTKSGYIEEVAKQRAEQRKMASEAQTLTEETKRRKLLQREQSMLLVFALLSHY